MNGQTYIYALHDPSDWSIRYVGKANDPVRRLNEHVGRNRLVMRSIKGFIKELRVSALIPGISVLQRCPKSEWRFWERFWIATIRASGAELFNISDGGNGPPIIGTMAGRSPSVETRAKLSASLKGRIVSEETRKLLKKPKSLQTRKKMSAWQLGRKISPESIAKMLLSRKDFKHSPESIAKISAASKRKRRPLSFETREKISAAHRGKRLSPEHVAKITIVHKRLERSSETGRWVS